MQRRHFLQSISLAAAGLYTSNLLAADFAKKKSLGVQLYSVRDAVSKNLEGALERLAALGFDNIELYGYNGTFFGKTAVEFKSILDKTGISVLSSHHVTGFASKGNGSLLNGWDKAVEDLHSIGAKYMACAYLMPNERTIENYTALPALLEKAGKTSKSAGIQMAYHNHDFEYQKFGDTTVYDHILTNTSGDLVKMEMDLYWTTKAGQDPVKYFEKYPGRFELWHVKDMSAGAGEITEIGNGVIDFDRIFAARKKAGMKHWFVEQDTSKGDMFESLKTSVANLSKKKY
ncbi:MAG: sugar phosphate isomerase/epimerase [Bacteroidota bacterium]